MMNNLFFPLAFVGVFLAFFVLFCLVIYVYTSFAYMTIARKLNHPHPWLAWIPFANVALILQLGGFHWAWVFLFFLPFFGWIGLSALSFISHWRIYEARNYPGWLALLPLAMVIPYFNVVVSLATLVILGFVAWKDQKPPKGARVVAQQKIAMKRAARLKAEQEIKKIQNEAKYAQGKNKKNKR